MVLPMLSGKTPHVRYNLPGLPLALLTSRELPSLLASNPYPSAVPTFEAHFEALEKENHPRPRVLVNSFDALEPEALKAIEKLNLVAVGPLVPYAFFDGSKDYSNGLTLSQNRR